MCGDASCTAGSTAMLDERSGCGWLSIEGVTWVGWERAGSSTGW